PDDRELVQEGVQQALARGGKFHWRERIVRPDGSVRLLDTVGEVLVTEQATTLLGTCRDVTEEQQRLEQLRCFADICSHLRVGLPAWARGGNDAADPFLLTPANPVLERIAGMPLAPLAGQPFRTVCPNATDGAMEALLREVAESAQT